MKKSIQMSETYLIGALLAIVGGFLDAYTYICRGAVFANAQTGNIVLMGIKFADGEFEKSLYYLIPIFSFISGVLLSEWIRRRYKSGKHLHWRQIIIIFEIGVLLLVSFIPQTQICNNITNALVSFVCSLQVQSFRKINNNAIATTMCTGNLRSATVYFYSYLETKDKIKLRKCIEYLGIIMLFIIGGGIGAIITNHFSIKAVLFAIIGLFIVFVLMFIKEKEEDKELTKKTL